MNDTRLDAPATAIAFDGFCKNFGTFEAVRDLTLHVGPGSICGLLGPNGAGKTTAMKCLLGFLHPSSGSVAIAGMPVTPQTFARTVYVPEVSALFEELKVSEHIELNRRTQPNHDPARAAELARTFSLDLRKRVRRLSKGQKNALALTLAFASNPKVLILDEPSSGLDPVFQRVVIDLMIEAAAGGATILFSSHQIGQVERAADRVAILRGGRLVLESDIEDLRAGEKIIEATFEGDVPDLNGALKQAAVRRIERSGTMVRVHVKDGGDEIARRLAGFNPSSLRVLDRNLEDVFLDVVTEKS